MPKIDNKGYVAIWRDGQWRREHRLVIETLLGRRLLPTENIHHRDGVKTNNAPTNLEIWTTGQPAGQRVLDLVNDSIDALNRYLPAMSVIGHERRRLDQAVVDYLAGRSPRLLEIPGQLRLW